jgi:ketosteroid isomerase-like protein
MRAQRFELRNAIVQGDQVAIEFRWTGTLAVPVGTLPAGGQMTGTFASFLELREGKIARQRSYDCFDSW